MTSSYHSTDNEEYCFLEHEAVLVWWFTNLIQKHPDFPCSAYRGFYFVVENDQSMMGYYCHDVIHPLIVNGEAILQVWRIGANMLNNQYLTVDKELLNSLGVGQIAH
jgi:hypothetical protein